jgi:hypothetical protein
VRLAGNKAPNATVAKAAASSRSSESEPVGRVILVAITRGTAPDAVKATAHRVKATCERRNERPERTRCFEVADYKRAPRKVFEGPLLAARRLRLAPGDTSLRLPAPQTPELKHPHQPFKEHLHPTNSHSSPSTALCRTCLQAVPTVYPQLPPTTTPTADAHRIPRALNNSGHHHVWRA